MKPSRPMSLWFGLSLYAIVLIAGCNDIGSVPPVPPPPPAGSFGVLDGTVYVLDSTSVSRRITGGTKPYRIISESDTAKAKASITTEDSLRVVARSVGWSTIIIGDASSPELRDTVRSLVFSVSYFAEVQPIFTNNCAFSSCHVTGGPAPFSLMPDTSWGSMVNVAAVSGPCRPILRVKPGSADSSALYLRIEGTCGQQMPLGGGGPLPITLRSKIRNWINEGALRN